MNLMKEEKSPAPLLQVFQGRSPDRIPVWFMRQAGRYLPEYRAIRKEHTFMEMLAQPELAVEVSLQPLRRFDIDAAIIFSDILPLLAAVGLEIEFPDKGGPRIKDPLTDAASLKRLHAFDPSKIEPTLKALQLCRAELAPDKAMLGFSGAPFTLACYAIEGHTSRDFPRTRAFLYHEPEAFSQLMQHLSLAIAEYLVLQTQSRADAVQLFDTWAGVVNEVAYRGFAEPANREVIRLFKERSSAPFIYFAMNACHLMPAIAELGADAYGIDWRLPLPKAAEILPQEAVLQGNLDPAILLGNPDGIQYAAQRILTHMKDRNAFIFNLGHGMIKETPPEHLAWLVEVIRQWEGANA